MWGSFFMKPHYILYFYANKASFRVLFYCIVYKKFPCVCTIFSIEWGQVVRSVIKWGIVVEDTIIWRKR